MTEHQEIWCQPSDQPKRQFVVIFDDPQMDLATFDDEAEARAFWEKANTNWTCYLLGTLPRDQSAERLRNAEIKEEVRKVLGCFAEAAASYDPDEGDGDQIAWAHDFKIGSLRAARALLSKLGEL